MQGLYITNSYSDNHMKQISTIGMYTYCEKNNRIEKWMSWCRGSLNINR